MKKNDTFELTIEDITDKGEGIGHLKLGLPEDGMTFFVKDAVVGDHVLAAATKLKKNYGYARLVKILSPSPDRVEPSCPVARPCGGCQLQSLSYQAQLQFKKEKVEGCFKRIGGLDVEVKPVIGMAEPVAYRNKAQFPVALDKDGKAYAGFYAGRTHSVIKTDYCGIQFPGHEKLLKAVLDYINEVHESVYNEETGCGLIRHILLRKGMATGQIMVVLVINGKDIKDRSLLINKVLEVPGVESIVLNINTENTNVILGNKCITIYGNDYIVDKIGDVSFKISALSFYQVNPVQTKVLYEKALELAGLTGEEIVWDLYCGIGTISLFLAKKAKKVYGVEIVPQAIENAKENARINGFTNAEFYVGAAEDVYLEKKTPADVIVVDPPRKGLEPELVKTIAAMGPKKIVYVSCDPATLARDVAGFVEGGYKVEEIQPVDLFPESVHVETVVLMSRVNR